NSGDIPFSYTSSDYSLPSVLLPPISLAFQRQASRKFAPEASSSEGEKIRLKCPFPFHYDVGNLIRRQCSSSSSSLSSSYSSYRSSTGRTAAHQQSRPPSSILLVPPPSSSSSVLSSPSSLLNSLRSAFAAGTSPPSAQASSSLPSPLVYIHPVTGTVHPYSQKPAPPSPTHLVLSLPPSLFQSDSPATSSRNPKDGRDTKKEKSSHSHVPHGGGYEGESQQLQNFILQQLRRTRSIHTLIIQYDGLWLSKLYDVLQGHPTITSVYLEYIHNLTERDLISSYVKILTGLSQCCSVYIRGCRLTSRGLKSFLQMLSRKQPHIRSRLKEIDF
ncbi:tyrosine kinase-like protein, partial [Cystoisospora suis]